MSIYFATENYIKLIVIMLKRSITKPCDILLQEKQVPWLCSMVYYCIMAMISKARCLENFMSETDSNLCFWLLAVLSWFHVLCQRCSSCPSVVSEMWFSLTYLPTQESEPCWLTQVCELCWLTQVCELYWLTQECELYWLTQVYELCWHNGQCIRSTNTWLRFSPEFRKSTPGKTKVYDELHWPWDAGN